MDSSHSFKRLPSFSKKIRSVDKKRLDDLFHKAHEHVFEQTDCLSCANCCKTTSPIFNMGDIERVAGKLRMLPSKFIDKYLHLDEDNQYVLNSSPCPFLDAENYCLVYDKRPTACKEYPHTNRKKMYQIIDLTLKNAEICPAVDKILQSISDKIM